MPANLKRTPEEIYQGLLALIEDILNKGKNYEPIEGKGIATRIEEAVERIMQQDDNLISLTVQTTPDNYLYAHSVNVCILSVKVGLGLGYDKAKLNDLGVAGFLHDIGMVKVTDITQIHRRLTNEEYESVKQHPLYGAEILKEVKDLTKVAVYAAHEHHERVTGNGYPRGIKNGEINEYARIVGLVDVYEALTHLRPHREGLLSYEALNEILGEKARFESQFLKVMIEQLSIYPLGNWVELNSGEIGKVVEVNKNLPLRPIVEIAFGRDGKKLSRAKTVDLSLLPPLFVRKTLRSGEKKDLRL